MFQPRAEGTSDGRGGPGDSGDFKAFRSNATRSRLEALSVSKHTAAARGGPATCTHTGCAAEEMIN